jgi:hypothetical protein
VAAEKARRLEEFLPETRCVPCAERIGICLWTRAHFVMMLDFRINHHMTFGRRFGCGWAVAPLPAEDSRRKVRLDFGRMSPNRLPVMSWRLCSAQKEISLAKTRGIWTGRFKARCTTGTRLW